MDTPIFEQVRQWVAGRNGPAWLAVERDLAESADVPTVRELALPPELFVECGPVVHEWGGGAGLFRAAVVVSASWSRVA